MHRQQYCNVLIPKILMHTLAGFEPGIFCYARAVVRNVKVESDDRSLDQGPML
jgi:hypothetical protein